MLGDDRLDYRSQERPQGLITASHLGQFSDWLPGALQGPRRPDSHVEALIIMQCKLGPTNCTLGRSAHYGAYS